MNKKNSTGIIIGSIFGGTVILLIAIAILTSSKDKASIVHSTLTKICLSNNS